MTILKPATSPTVGQSMFAQRASELGVPCYCLDTSLNLITEPGIGWLAIDSQRIAAVRAAGLSARSHRKPVRSTTADGFDLLTFSDSQGAVVVDLTDWDTRSLPRDQMVRILDNYYQDLKCIAEDQKAIEGFNAQLSQSYEEVNLTFRMAKFLTSSAPPSEVVQTMGNELREVLRYGWLAIALDDGPAVLAALRGVSVYSGGLPCTMESLAGEISALRTQNHAKVLLPAHSSLATTSGSEVVVERITQNNAVIGLLVTGNRQGDDPDVSSNELQLVTAAASFLGLFHQNAFRFAEQGKQFLGTLNALSAAVDAKDPYTQGHSERVALLASQMALKLGLDAQTAETFRVAGLLHDIGKIGVPEAVLRKPAKLTDEEFELIKKHPEIGYRILKDLPSLGFHLPGVLHHHERWDGRGYPHKLHGDNIPLLARVLAFADTFDAMSSNRSYRSAMPRSRVLEEIRASAGTQFDPQLVELFATIDFSQFDQRLAASAAQSAGEVSAASSLIHRRS